MTSYRRYITLHFSDSTAALLSTPVRDEKPKNSKIPNFEKLYKKCHILGREPRIIFQSTSQHRPCSETHCTPLTSIGTFRPTIRRNFHTSLISKVAAFFLFRHNAVWIWATSEVPGGSREQQLKEEHRTPSLGTSIKGA